MEWPSESRYLAIYEGQTQPKNTSFLSSIWDFIKTPWVKAYELGKEVRQNEESFVSNIGSGLKTSVISVFDTIGQGINATIKPTMKTAQNTLVIIVILVIALLIGFLFFSKTKIGARIL